jgi:hypothetical protein
MENSIWIDLGHIGHKASSLKELFRSTHLVELPIDTDVETQKQLSNENTWVVFIDYTIGGSGSIGVKVLTNAFNTELQFYKTLANKLINEYVEINQSLDFKQNF